MAEIANISEGVDTWAKGRDKRPVGRENPSPEQESDLPPVLVAVRFLSRNPVLSPYLFGAHRRVRP